MKITTHFGDAQCELDKMFKRAVPPQRDQQYLMRNPLQDSQLATVLLDAQGLVALYGEGKRLDPETLLKMGYLFGPMLKVTTTKQTGKPYVDLLPW